MRISVIVHDYCPAIFRCPVMADDTCRQHESICGNSLQKLPLGPFIKACRELRMGNPIKWGVNQARILPLLLHNIYYSPAVLILVER